MVNCDTSKKTVRRDDTTAATKKQQKCWFLRRFMPKMRRSTVRKMKKFAIEFGGKVCMLLPFVSFTLYVSSKSFVDFAPGSNPHSFNYKILETDTCSDLPNMTVVILAHSSPSNIERRNSLRRSWANYKLLVSQNTTLLFFMGQSHSPQVNKAVIKESELYHDIIQEDYIDSYRNMTYKFMSVIKWTVKFCSHVRYMLKIDDDVFINILALGPFLRKPEITSLLDYRSILCKTWVNEKPVRLRRKNIGKWAVSFREFHAKVYPVYCSGMFVLLSLRNAKKIFEMSMQLSYFWIDDVFMTGIVAAKLKLLHHHLPNVRPYGNPVVQFNKDNAHHLNSYHTDGNYNHIYTLWNLYQKKIHSLQMANYTSDSFTANEL